MYKYLLLSLTILSTYCMVAMQQPVREYDQEKTKQLKSLLNGHSLSDPLPHIQIKQLIFEGADPNVKADENHYKGCSWFEALLLHSHVCEHFWCTTDFLYKNGASPNLHPRNVLGSTCYSFWPERIPRIIQWGADIHGQNSQGESPLFSTIHGHIALMKYSMSSLPMRVALAERLLKLGAASDIDLPNKEGETPLTLAKKHNLTAMVELLESHKVKAP